MRKPWHKIPPRTSCNASPKKVARESNNFRKLNQKAENWGNQVAQTRTHPPRKSLRRYLANVTTPEGGGGREERNQLPFPHCPPPLSPPPPIPFNSAPSLPLQAPPPRLPRSLLLLLFFSSPPSPLSFPTLKRKKEMEERGLFLLSFSSFHYVFFLKCPARQFLLLSPPCVQKEDT